MKKIVGFMFVVILIMTSCKKEDEQSTSYIGKWTTSYVEDGFPFTEELVLTTNAFELIRKIDQEGQPTIDFNGLKGDMTVSGAKLTFSPTDLAMAEITEIEPGYYEIGAFEWFHKGADIFTQYIDDYGGETINAEFDVDGEIMILKVDVDGNGTYISDEITTYTKI